mmetsp:Transcript_102050/g.179789  ORF Transcript_102050/g.179789 Transcript_102050/m.179789 type:complete len:115 (+) Transcript_102050:134-478(+)
MLDEICTDHFRAYAPHFPLAACQLHLSSYSVASFQFRWASFDNMAGRMKTHIASVLARVYINVPTTCSRNKERSFDHQERRYSKEQRIIGNPCLAELTQCQRHVPSSTDMSFHC